MSKDLLYELIEALTILPGVGKKSAQRMALFLLDKNKDGAAHLAKTLEECLETIQRCEVCRQLTSEPICRICSDSSRDVYSLCVVESPSDGISPDDLGIPDLLRHIQHTQIEEVILATSSTVEGDATASFIKDHLQSVKVSRISYGIPIGGELEYVDGNTIARAIQGRIEI
jgi:recombination protein RecR